MFHPSSQKMNSQFTLRPNEHSSTCGPKMNFALFHSLSLSLSLVGRANKAQNVLWTCGGLLLDNIAIIWGHHLELLIHHSFNLWSHLQETWVVHPCSTQVIITFTKKTWGQCGSLKIVKWNFFICEEDFLQYTHSNGVVMFLGLEVERSCVNLLCNHHQLTFQRLN
jgi:hypothetical protein